MLFQKYAIVLKTILEGSLCIIYICAVHHCLLVSLFMISATYFTGFRGFDVPK